MATHTHSGALPYGAVRVIVARRQSTGDASMTLAECAYAAHVARVRGASRETVEALERETARLARLSLVSSSALDRLAGLDADDTVALTVALRTGAR